MRLVQAFRKLACSKLKGLNITTGIWEDVTFNALLESDQRWISERIGFNARRVLLTEFEVPYSVVKVADDSVERILYSEQKAVRASVFLYDYTILDRTHTVQTVTFETTTSPSGMETGVIETLSNPYPVHIIRYAKADSEVADSIDYSRSYGFAPGDVTVDTNNELQASNGDRYLIEEAETELLTTRLMLVKR